MAGDVSLQRAFVEHLYGIFTVLLWHTPWLIVMRPDTEPVLTRWATDCKGCVCFSLQASEGLVLSNDLLTPRL